VVLCLRCHLIDSRGVFGCELMIAISALFPLTAYRKGMVTKMKKTMKISSKITFSFVLVNTIYMICILASLWSYSLSNNRLNKMNRETVQPEKIITEIHNAVLSARVSLRELVLFDPSTSEYSLANKAFEAEKQKAISSVAKYRDIMTDASDKNAAIDFLDYYENDYSSFATRVINLSKENQDDAIIELSSAAAGIESAIDEKLIHFSNIVDGRIDYFLDDAQLGFNRLLIIAVAVIVIVMTLVVIIIRSMKRSISKRIEALSRNAELLATGVLDANVKCDNTDEIGQLTGSFLSMIESNKLQAATLASIADGDLTVDVIPRCDLDTMGNAIKKMVNHLNEIFDEVTASTEQVSGGANQIAYGAQALAQGATEQTSAVEELSNTITQVLTQTQDNSRNARMCLELVNKAGNEMQDSVKYMEELKTTMSGVSSSADKISQIIKVIDDIAFQTNILALNAAVEAARAGQHGKGFAVVADEVRNLASKSATAAKETASLIQTSVEYIQMGNTMVEKTNQSVSQVSQTAQKAQESIIEINDASQKQEESISQINAGIEQIAQVVQTNSATAEESASASEELSGQAQILKQLLSYFKIRHNPIVSVSGSGFPMLESSSKSSLEAYSTRSMKKW